jgi:hypothetical protein
VEVLGIRFCSVTQEAESLAAVFDSLGLPRREMSDESNLESETAEFSGAVFPAGTGWIEVWPEGPELPAGILLQIVVDDATAFAAHAKKHGLDPQGPVDAHGERIYFLQAPSGLPITFQSALKTAPDGNEEA